MVCPGCDKTVSKNDKICPLCGYKLKDETSDNETSQASPSVSVQSHSKKKPIAHNKKIEGMSTEEKRELAMFMDAHDGMTPEEVARQNSEEGAADTHDALLTSPEQPEAPVPKESKPTTGRTSQGAKSSQSSASMKKSSSAQESNVRRGAAPPPKKTVPHSPAAVTPSSSAKSATQPPVPTAPKTKKVKSKDRGNFILNLISFFLPFVGTFYNMSAKSYYPVKAKAAKISSVLGIFMYVILYLFMMYGIQIEQVSDFIIKDLGIK